ncbi:MAG: peptidase dimerization domain protein [Candidatus Amoebophilus sp. 36-38]|mgnify:CR=1 FL=1|nr:MAG: peptidase dimerization domain protein [Candidatus Amoebophilus sp. 36-38]
MHTSDYIAKYKSRFIEELMAFLRIPSISTMPEHKQDIKQAANFIKDQLVAAGADKAWIIETTGHPLVYGEKIIDRQLPTVLVYGHYDVQPAEPYELWNSKPFEPLIKGDKIFARGAADDKGQFYIHVKALETMIATQSLPCNIKFLIEGEEEMGSGSLTNFLEDSANHNLLQADAILVSDTTIISMDQPSLTTGLRGIVYLEVTLTGANRDLHSGVYGGAVANPINILCKMLAALHDENGHITIPGFYDEVPDLTVAERAELNSIPFDLEAYKQTLGINEVIGEKGYTTLERVGIRPSLDVNGIWGGYIGTGAKTVLPSQAHAKVSMRLAPNQDAQKVMNAFVSYFSSLAPKGTQVAIKPYHGGCNAVVLDKNSLAFRAAENAFETVWGKHPFTTREGGSIPIIAKFKEKLGTDAVLMGFGLDTDAIHSPNEHFSLIAFFKGISTVIKFYENLAALYKK